MGVMDPVTSLLTAITVGFGRRSLKRILPMP